MKDFIFAAEMKAFAAKNRLVKAVRSFTVDEKGDTNFISIIIILGIVVALATLFMTFKNKIIEVVQGDIESFTTK